MYVRGLQCFMWGGIMYSAFCYSNEVPDEISLQEKLVKKKNVNYLFTDLEHLDQGQVTLVY